MFMDTMTSPSPPPYRHRALILPYSLSGERKDDELNETHLALGQVAEQSKTHTT